jgi:hypothetical protein
VVTRLLSGFLEEGSVPYPGKGSSDQSSCNGGASGGSVAHGSGSMLQFLCSVPGFDQRHPELMTAELNRNLAFAYHVVVHWYGGGLA